MLFDRNKERGTMKSAFRPDRTLWLPLGVVLLLLVFFSFTSGTFATVRNFTIISAQASTLLIVCTGATFVVLMGSIDLSVGAVVLLVGAVCVKVENGTGMGGSIILVAAILEVYLGSSMELSTRT